MCSMVPFSNPSDSGPSSPSHPPTPSTLPASASAPFRASDSGASDPHSGLSRDRQGPADLPAEDPGTGAPERDAVADVRLGDLPDTARLWIFGVSRPLDSEEELRLVRRLRAFVGEWAAHGHPLAAAFEWREGRFLMVGVDDRIQAPTGCSIDALIRALGRLEEEMGVEMVGNAPVWYRNAEGEPERVSRPEFRRLAREGAIGEDTPVFDLSLTRVRDLLDGKFEGPARERWHARLLS